MIVAAGAVMHACLPDVWGGILSVVVPAAWFCWWADTVIYLLVMALDRRGWSSDVTGFRLLFCSFINMAWSICIGSAFSRSCTAQEKAVWSEGDFIVYIAYTADVRIEYYQL